MYHETQPSRNIGIDDPIDPGPAVGPAEIVILFVALLIGLGVSVVISSVYAKITGKTPRRSADD